uniref:Uncharacterized protein n=1 Tax=Romanomermis culicivorax TaxID=13658 RepID=A0A915HDI3_ROMCU
MCALKLLLEWLKERGFNDHGLEIRQQSDDQRGVYSNCEISEQEIVLEIPEKLIITPVAAALSCPELKLAIT